MRYQTCLFLVQSILCNQYNLISTKTMVGNNVRRATEGEFISVVSIKLINDSNTRQENDHGCTGVIVSNNKVLTVAHAIIRIPIERLEVAAGTIDIRRSRKFRIRRLITYNMWANEKQIYLENQDNDVAFLLLNETLSDMILPVHPYFIENTNLYGLDVIAAGYGRTMNGKTRYMDTAVLRVLPEHECIRRIEKLVHKRIIYDSRLLCSSVNPPVILRKGDSGGPLFYNGALIALNIGASPFSDENLHPEKVNMHLGLSYFECFISDIMNNV